VEEDCEFKANLGYVAQPYVKKQNKTNKNPNLGQE
jgi:hypothetical protein